MSLKSNQQDKNQVSIRTRRTTNNVLCADFETTSYEQYKQEGLTRVYLWYMINVSSNKEYRGISLSSFMQTLENMKDLPYTIYFHNLSFDGEFILWWLLENEFDYVTAFTNVGGQSNEFTTIIDETGSIYMINIRFKEHNCPISFKCSYKLFPASIKDIGRLVGIEKLDETHDYNEIKNYKTIDEVTQEEWSYVRNDVRIAVALIKYLHEKGIKSMTMSSSAYKNWQKEQYWTSKLDMTKDSNEEIVEIVRKSYKGGITKVNPVYAGVEFDSVMSFDVNSLYPSVMYNNSMPIGNGKIFKDVKTGISKGYKKFIVVTFVRSAKVRKGKHAFVGTHSTFSYSRAYDYEEEIENKYLYLWLDEFKLFEQVYDADFTIEKVVGWKAKNNMFKAYIERWYAIKENPKNDVEKKLAKLMLNSLYGKFGMNDERISKIPLKIVDDYIDYDTNTNSTTYYYKEVASYITSMARVKYATFMNMCGDNFIYGDTDSIYYKGNVIPDMLKPFIDPKKIGYWDYEGHYTRFKALKAKCYLKQLENGEIVRKIAGCPKDCAKEINFDNFEFGLKIKGKKKQKRKVKGGIVIKPTDFTLKG